jgi:quinol monooxygenase YgiN
MFETVFIPGGKMTKKLVIVQVNLKPDADPALVEKLKRCMVDEFFPAEREAPGLLSIELFERFRDLVPHQPNNRASDLAVVELWEDAEANHRWWAGKQTERLRKAMQTLTELTRLIAGETLDCHYTLVG